MSSARHSFHWRPERSGVGAGLDAPLVELLAPLIEDRASTAAALVAEASEVLTAWLQAQPEEWSWENAAQLRSRDLAAFADAHGWRGPAARWLDAIERLPNVVAEAPPRELLLEELGLWLGGEDGVDAGDEAWSGEPLEPGRRLPERMRCAEAIESSVARGEVIVVHGYSDTVACALEGVQASGRGPEIVLSEGGPDLGGRRMARRLAPSGAKLRLVYDAALAASVGRADRVWIGTEGIGALSFTARLGTRALLDEARRLEVPSCLLATSDKLMPAGEQRLPAWADHETWLLWEDAPEGVRVDSQPWEAVPLSLVDTVATEHGPERAADLALRCLRTDTAR